MICFTFSYNFFKTCKTTSLRLSSTLKPKPSCCACKGHATTTSDLLIKSQSPNWKLATSTNTRNLISPTNQSHNKKNLIPFGGGVPKLRNSTYGRNPPTIIVETRDKSKDLRSNPKKKTRSPVMRTWQGLRAMNLYKDLEDLWQGLEQRRPKKLFNKC